MGCFTRAGHAWTGRVFLAVLTACSRRLGARGLGALFAILTACFAMAGRERTGRVVRCFDCLVCEGWLREGSRARFSLFSAVSRRLVARGISGALFAVLNCVIDALLPL